MRKDELAYRRHPGRCDIMWGIEMPGKKDGEIFEKTESLPGDHNLLPEDLRTRVEKRLTEDRNTIEAFVFSRDGGHFITYTRKNLADLASDIPDPDLNAIPDTDVAVERPRTPRVERKPTNVGVVVAAETDDVADAAGADDGLRNPRQPAAPKPRAERVAKSGPTVFETVAGKLPDPPLTGNLAALYSAYMKFPDGATKDQVLAAVTWADPPPQIPEGRVTSGTSWLKAHGLLRVKA